MKIQGIFYLTGIFLCLGLLLCYGEVHAESAVVHELDFSEHVPDISQAMSWQYAAPENPCRGPDGSAHWERRPESFGIKITQSVPCKTVLPLGLDFSSADELTFEWDWNITSVSQDRNMIISWQDQVNFLELHIFEHQVFLEHLTNGQTPNWSQTRGSFPFQSNTQYQVRAQVSRSRGELKLWINQVLVIDSKLTGAQVPPFLPALSASVGHGSQTSESFFTHFTVKNTSNRLQVIPWMQNDPRWATLVYDSAEEWSHDPPTLARWGCALTSAAIILDYYGVEALPNGQGLNPATLNAWLLEQPDGYLGPGLLNWRAVVRVASWHKNEHGTPALEFRSFTATDSEEKAVWLQAQLSKRYPSILEQPGHFVVATGVAEDGEVAIHDPLFPRESLAQYDHTFVSGRQFTPSYTNLLGGVIAVPEWFTPEVVDLYNQPVQLIPLENQSGWQLWDVPLESSGTPLKITNPHSFPIPVQGWMYSPEGNQQEMPSILPPHSTTRSDKTSSYRLTDQDFARLLSWDELRSPVFWQIHRELENAWPHLSQDERETLGTHYQWILTRAQSGGWITQSAQLLLRQDLEPQ